MQFLAKTFCRVAYCMALLWMKVSLQVVNYLSGQGIISYPEIKLWEKKRIGKRTFIPWCIQLLTHFTWKGIEMEYINSKAIERFRCLHTFFQFEMMGCFWRPVILIVFLLTHPVNSGCFNKVLRFLSVFRPGGLLLACPMAQFEVIS